MQGLVAPLSGRSPRLALALASARLVTRSSSPASVQTLQVRREVSLGAQRLSCHYDCHSGPVRCLRAGQEKDEVVAPSRSGGSSAAPACCLYGLWGTRTAMQSQWNLLSTRPARHSLPAAVQRGHLARPSPDPDGRTAIGPSYITPTHTG